MIRLKAGNRWAIQASHLVREPFHHSFLTNTILPGPHIRMQQTITGSQYSATIAAVIYGKLLALPAFPTEQLRMFPCCLEIAGILSLFTAIIISEDSCS